MTEAQKFFSDSAIAKDKCKLLAEEYEESIRLEKEKVSLFSPENVLDYEDIARQIFSPIHIDQETQELNTLALDDMFNKGLSVNRLKLTLITDLHLKGEEKAENDRVVKPDRTYVGMVQANVCDIRNVTDNVRWFTVYDTSLENDISHADVCCIYQPSEFTKTQKKALKSRQRSLLQKVFSKIKKP